MMFISIDIETGGLDPTKHSLLTVAALVFDDVMPENPVSFLQLSIKPGDEGYRVTPGALAINHINLVEHAADGKTQDGVRYMLSRFLEFHKKLGAIPLGHNYPFDTEFLDYQLFGHRGAVNELLGHRYIDTMPILQMLYVQGIVPKEAASLNGACDHFGLKVDGAHHTAYADAFLTWKLFQEVRKIIGVVR